MVEGRSRDHTWQGAILTVRPVVQWTVNRMYLFTWPGVDLLTTGTNNICIIMLDPLLSYQCIRTCTYQLTSLVQDHATDCENNQSFTSQAIFKDIPCDNHKAHFWGGEITKCDGNGNWNGKGRVRQVGMDEKEDAYEYACTYYQGWMGHFPASLRITQMCLCCHTADCKIVKSTWWSWQMEWHPDANANGSMAEEVAVLEKYGDTTADTNVKANDGADDGTWHLVGGSCLYRNEQGGGRQWSCTTVSFGWQWILWQIVVVCKELSRFWIRFRFRLPQMHLEVSSRPGSIEQT